MDSHNPLKLRISRLFRSSFGSCKSRNISDVIDRPVFSTQTHQLIELFSPISGSKYPQTPETHLFPRRKVSGRNSLLDTLSDSRKSDPNPKHKKSRKKTKKTKPTHMIKNGNFESLDNYYDWFSSEDDSEDDETTLFSSKSLSSDSSDSFLRKKRNSRRRRGPPVKGKVKGSFAVVKRSSDPYGDFRSSMVEMIVEKQIFRERDLENLLETFLSLNSDHHHSVIIDVFTEICETLFR